MNNSDLKEKIDRILDSVVRPGRYVGNEYNVVKKSWEETAVHIVLAFPDLYEIGMSHLGLGILYHILNSHDWILAERVYSPWIDMEDRMRSARIPLFSLESKLPINKFDMIGITLQYELHYTNILNLLDLSSVPIHSEQRGPKDPIVVAGGPCAFNVEPIADFLDCVVLGDGEGVVVEIARLLRKAKLENLDRKEILRLLSTLDGVYVPSFYKADYDSHNRFITISPVEDGIPEKISARIEESLPNQNYPDKPLVPLIEVTHDRFSLEIMRGCSRGCRFCNAGIIYRPLRQRSLNDLLKHASEVLKNTGYEEVSLVSLSTSDYDDLFELIYNLKKIDHISISLPSIRPDIFKFNVADFLVDFKRSGLTLAPEAGSRRLCDVINKNIDEDELFDAIKQAYKKGWTRIKLYYMIGLPSERWEDLEGIVEQINRIATSRITGERGQITVSISPFCPKPHTPFQWESMNSIKLLNEKILFIRHNIKSKRIKLNWRGPEVSILEAVLGRGDRRLSSVIYRAWKMGSRFEAWSDRFNFHLWLDAFQKENLSIDDYLNSKSTTDALPWDHLSKGVLKSFLIKEREKSLTGNTTPDCRLAGCTGCGLRQHPVCQEIIKGNVRKEDINRRVSLRKDFEDHSIKTINGGKRYRVRIQYRKGRPARFTSHLDTIRILMRGFRRANVQIVMSQGYHARPKISSGPPLALGFMSRVEYIDVEIVRRPGRNFVRLLNRSLPHGLKVIRFKEVFGYVESLNNSINLSTYRIRVEGPLTEDKIKEFIDDFMKKNSYRITRKKGRASKEVDIRPYVLEMYIKNGDIFLTTRLDPQGTARVDEVLKALFNYYWEFMRFEICRTGLFIESHGRRITPMEVI